MDYLKELTTIQTWIKAAADLNSFRLKEAKPKVARPVILFETPSRGKSRNLSQYQYVVPVRQYGKLFVNSVEQAQDLQETIIKDLEEKYGVLPIYEGETGIGYLKAVIVEFEQGDDLDIPFSIKYEATYGRTRPVEPPSAEFVGTKVISGDAELVQPREKFDGADQFDGEVSFKGVRNE